MTGDEPPVNEVKYDKKGRPIGYKKPKEKYDPDDPTGLSGYCGAPLDPDDPEYQHDVSKSPYTAYYGAKNLTG